MTSPDPGYYQNELRDLRGNAQVGAVVDVFVVGTTTPATVYADANRTPMVASPLPAAAGLNRPGIDAAANIAFFAEDTDAAGMPAEYDVRATYGANVFTFRAKPAPAPPSFITASAASQLIGRLRAGNEHAVLAVLGDSTGVGAARWVYLTAQWLGTQYPAYTVAHRAWNDGNQNYDAATTIQTGTGTANAGGPYTLTIYNGSTSGQSADYSYLPTRLVLQVPVTPHLIIVNYGHNNVGTTTAYRYQHYSLMRALADGWPAAGLMTTVQNPRISSDGEYSNDLYRQQQIVDLAATEGHEVINVGQRFLDYPSYASALLMGDGLHPNDATGSPLWAAEVKKHLSRSVTLTPRSVPPRPNQLWIPARAFDIWEGSPVLALTNARYFAWALDQATQQSVVATVDVPPSWLAVNIYMKWSFATGSGYTGSNNVFYAELGLSSLGTFVSPITTHPAVGAGGYTSNLTQATASNSGAFAIVTTRLLTNTAVTTRPTAIRIRRVAASATDTLAESAYLIGAYVERAA